MMRKTALVTAASVAGVILAGGAAVGANVSILNSGGTDAVGQLAAEGASSTSATTPTAPTTTSTPSAIQTYEVDSAGTVTIENNGSAITLDGVSTNSGWTWEKSDVTNNLIALKFTASDGDEILFLALRDDDGSVSAGAERPDLDPITVPEQPVSSSPQSTTPERPSTDSTSDIPAPPTPIYVESNDDDDHGRGHDEDHDDDERDHEDHEGRDDDD